MISTSSAIEKNASSPEPMQIDAAQYKPLSQEEKDRHCLEGLCFYCGSSKHKLPECLIKLKGLKARSATSLESGYWKTKMSGHSRDHETKCHQV
jgi:hypothetical protein